MTSYRRMFGYFGGLAFLLTLNLAVVTPANSQITQVTGKVTLKQADGTVTVNGSPALAGATILSGATVTTAKGSSGRSPIIRCDSTPMPRGLSRPHVTSPGSFANTRKLVHRYDKVLRAFRGSGR